MTPAQKQLAEAIVINFLYWASTEKRTILCRLNEKDEWVPNTTPPKFVKEYLSSLPEGWGETQVHERKA